MTTPDTKVTKVEFLRAAAALGNDQHFQVVLGYLACERDVVLHSLITEDEPVKTHKLQGQAFRLNLILDQVATARDAVEKLRAVTPG